MILLQRRTGNLREETAVKLPKNIGMLLLGIWLILTGLIVIAPGLSFSEMPKVTAVLALVAGAFILLGK